MADDDESSGPMDIDYEPTDFVINPEDICLCNGAACLGNLSQQLDAILDPKIIFSGPNQPDRIWTVLAHGYPDASTYIEKLNEFRLEKYCGLTWSSSYVAYRCRTCSQAPTMAICTECFRAGDHQGHDYNMFKSRSGGACDCGYTIMKSSGHCSNHGLNANAPKSHESVPHYLTCLPKRAMPRLLSRLVIQLRRQAVGQTNETDIYLDCLINIANSSTIIRSIMIQVILSEEAYSSQAHLLFNHSDPRVSRIVQESQKILKKERKKLASIKLPPNFAAPLRPVNAFLNKSPPKTFLEELVFWMVVYEFNQKLVCFLLCFLMDPRYKETFMRLFVNYYPSIALCLTNSSEEPLRHPQDSFEHLSRRILQVSVQLYNDGDLTRKICDDEMTLHTLIYCIRIMIEGSQADGIYSALRQNPLCQHSAKVVCCDNQIFLDRQLGSLTEDLQGILEFEHETKRLLSDKNLLNIWMEMLAYFQTMRPFKRELYEHAPYETGARLSVFMIESEFCLMPLWTILGHLKSGGQAVHYTKNLLESIQFNLCKWFSRMFLKPNSKLDAYHISFHIPLHRMFAATIRHMIYDQGVPEKLVYVLLSNNQTKSAICFGGSATQKSSTITVDDFFRMLLLHPLQALSLYHQVRCGMWTRNGLTTVNQAITYIHCAYCYLIIDMDMFLLRYCASRLKPDTFLRTFLQKFYSWRCLSFTCGPIFTAPSQDTLRAHYYFNIQSEQISQMFESCLVTLIQLLTLSNHCNISERDQTRQELISLLSAADRPYSYLVEMLPNMNEQSKNEMFASLLEEVAIYKPALHGVGGNLQQGSYTLKPNTWKNDYNPILILYRYYQRRDYQQSLERFFDQTRLNSRHHSGLWPPLKIPEQRIANFGLIDLGPLLACHTLLGIIFSTLFKCVYVEDIPDHTMAYIIHLLELSLRREEGSEGKTPLKSSNFTGKFTYRELISYCENLPRKEAILRGRTIYSVVCPVQETVAHTDIRYFPFVKHSLDLAFDTWFPFDSILNNCMVHIETVHSLPRDEFDLMIQTLPHNTDRSEDESTTHNDESHHTSTISSLDLTPERNLPDMSATSSTRSTESQTAVWSNLIGFEVDELDDLDIDVDVDHDMDELENIEEDEIDEDEDGTLDLEDAWDGGEESDEQGDLNESGQTDSEASMFSQASVGRTLIASPHQGVATRSLAVDAASNLTTFSITTTRNSGPTSALDEPDANRTGWTPRGSGVDPPAQSEPLLPPHFSGSFDGTTRGPTFDSSGSAIIHHARTAQAAHDQSTSSFALVETGNNTVEQQQQQQQHGETISNDCLQHIFQQQQQQPAQAQNLITERRAILDVPPRPMITNPPQPLALEGIGAVASSVSASANIPRGANDGSTNPTTNQELQSQHQQQQGEQTLSTRPPALSSLPVDPRDFLELVNQMEQRRHQHQQHHHQQQQQPTTSGRSNQIERSLSEVDIQARFMGFFQSDVVSRVNSRGIMRPRREPRRFIRYSVVGSPNNRDAYRTTAAAAEPYLAYNNQNNNNNNNTNNNESVQELVRRSVAVVPAIVDAVRATGQSAATAAAAATGHLHHHHNYAEQQRLNRFLPTDQRSRRLRKEHRQHHGESILTLLLRLHAKYSQRPRSYKFDPERAQANLASSRCRLGDGAHFVTIALDLICSASKLARMRTEHLIELIWPTPCAAAEGNEKSSTESVDMENDRTLNERRRLAKERRDKLMAQFACKQRAFMEKYEAGNGSKYTSGVATDKTTEQPINLSSKSSDQEPSSQSLQLTLADNNGQRSIGQQQQQQQQQQHNQQSGGEKRVPPYECCICGVEGPIDLTNPLGQVVLLQSTSVHGHSHLRPKHERRLPCDEPEHLALKEETYAKYLERRIDVLSNHFGESSWLDSFNIGAEGGVHVQSCGHHLHIECHQSYIRSLDREEGLRPRQDSDEFQCPVCRQLANSVLPILHESFFSASGSSDIKESARPGLRKDVSQCLPTSSKATTTTKHNDSLDGQEGGGDGQSSHGASQELSQPSEMTPSGTLDDQIAQVALQLRARRAPDQRELQSSATFCRHLTKATGPQYRLVRTNASMHSLFLFLSSIARTNLETGLIARSIRRTGEAVDAAEKKPCGGHSRGSDKRIYFQSLFHVLALNAQTLINDQWYTYDRVWTRLTHSTSEIDKLIVRPANSEVPLLLRDPIAMLLQFLFAVSSSKSHERSHFVCLMKILFNLTVIQSAALVLSYVEESRSMPSDIPGSKSPATTRAERQHNDNDEDVCESLDPSSKRNKQQPSENATGLEGLLALVWTNLGQLLTRTKEEPLMNSVVRTCWPRHLLGLAGHDDGRLGLSLLGRTRREGQRDAVQQATSSGDDGTLCSAGPSSGHDDGRADRAKRLKFIENKIKLACLPFLRAAAFLQEHLYARPTPNLFWELDQDCLSLERVESDFSQLVACLELGGTANLLFASCNATSKQTELGTFAPISLEQTLNWPSSNVKGAQHPLVAIWANELLHFARDFSIAARTLLLCRPLVWFRPALMQLPHTFDDIFMFYYRRKCSLCQQVPKDVAVCLVCGAPICFRVSCCKDRSRSRQVHSQHCGANTAVFLAVHTSSVVVIRGSRACVWGSVYLDAHDEEDNGLQRGKPLHLVPARYALLEAQWLAHSFDHTCGKRWIYLQEVQ